MRNLSFDPDNTLAGGLYAMTPREAIRLGIGLCEAVEDAVGADGCHGAVWPGNITAVDGKVVLGPAGSGSVAGLEPDALEFISPEQFWNGQLTPASDVYSIGLVLYTALNNGVMPFFEPDKEHTPEARAYALQSRMKGSPLPYPRSAGRELADVVEKAVAFSAEDRYEKPATLKQALQSLPEGAAIPAVAPVIPMTESEIQNAHSYKVDKNFEEVVPDKQRRAPARKMRENGEVDENMDAKEFRKTPKKKGRWILPVVLILLILAAGALLLRSCRDFYDDDFPIETPSPANPGEASSAIHPPVPTATPVPVNPEPTPESTPEPTPTETPKPKYELFIEDVTWEQAKARCEEKGGHLATVRSEEQFEEIVALALSKDVRFVWLGAYRASNGHWYYVTGDALTYTKWDQNEPSAMDLDGTREDYLLLWYRRTPEVWSYNDMRNDPISVARATYSGKLAYICEYN